MCGINGPLTKTEADQMSTEEVIFKVLSQLRSSGCSGNGPEYNEPEEWLCGHVNCHLFNTLADRFNNREFKK